MRETIDALQTVIILTALLLCFVMLLGSVYTLRLLIAALKQLAQMMAERPVVSAQTFTATAVAPTEKAVVVEKPKETADETKETVVLPRYKCHHCNAKLPENPVSSRIDGAATFLNYKCGRCGKQTEFDLAAPVT